MTTLFEPLEVPDVTDVVTTLDYANGDVLVYWSPPQVLSTERHDGTAISGVDVDGLIEVLVCDSELEGAAFTWKNGAGDSHVTVEIDTPRAMRVLYLYYQNVGTVPSVDVYHSDDGVSFSAVSGAIAQEMWRTAEVVALVVRWPDDGEHLYWRAARNSAWTHATPVTELWFRYFAGDFEMASGADLVEYRVIVRDSIAKRVIRERCPTAEEPLNIREVALWPTSEGAAAAFGINGAFNIEDTFIYAVATTGDGVEYLSPGYQLYGTAYETSGKSVAALQYSEPWELTGGSTHAAFPLSVGPGQLELSLTGAGTVTFRGFDASKCTGGEVLRLYVGAGLTIALNAEDAAETAENRITAPATQTIVGPGYAVLYRIAATERWWFDHCRDGGGLR